jgi:hypothetical protein
LLRPSIGRRRIVPIAGEEFTKRVLTPFKENAFEFLVYQGARIDRVMRLLSNGIEIQKRDGSFIRFIENGPRRPQEYEEFRRMALHLAWLSASRQLFVRSLVFEETLIADFKEVPRAEDIGNGFNRGRHPDHDLEMKGPSAIPHFPTLLGYCHHLMHHLTVILERLLPVCKSGHGDDVRADEHPRRGHP